MALVDAVGGGSYTYYFVGRHSGDAGIDWAQVINLQLTALYVPTAYGSVVSPAPPQPGDSRATDAAAEGESVQLIDHGPIVKSWQADRIRQMEERLRQLEATVQQLRGEQ